MNFIGIDVHLHSVVIAAIDENLNIIEVSNVSFEEAINIIEAYLPTIISIDAPSSLNKGLMNDEEYRKNIGRNIKGHYNKKVSEYELSRRGINPFPTPDYIEKVRSRNYLSWMESGFLLYNNLIEKGYILLNDNNYIDSLGKGIVEVFPHASFSTLSGQLLQNKNTPKGLEQRLLLLRELGMRNIDSIMKDIKNKDKDDYVDSIIAAYTGYAIYNGKGSFVGDSVEGQIALPINDIEEKYKRSKPKEKSIATEYRNNRIYEYEFLHSDSVLWLKHFIPLHNTPNIKEVLNIKYEGFNVRMIITNDEGESVDVALTNMKGRTQGLKVTDKYKSVLKEFWGSHGDGIKYKIEVRGISKI